MSNIKENLKHIKAFVFDVDGVFSSTKLILDISGKMMRSMNIKDGYALHYALRKEYHTAIITGGNTDAVKIRFENLGVKDIYMQSSNKLGHLHHFANKYKLNFSDILYMGDDLPDYEVMQKVGFPSCPADAVQEIKSVSRYISDKNGGEGCVRDVIEQVMKVQGKWMNDDAFSW